METSFKFKHIENNLIKLLMLFIGNQNICKYIYYLNDDPLNNADVSIDLINNGNIIVAPYNEKIIMEEKVIVFLNPLLGSLDNYPLSTITYEMDIVTPIDKWILSGLGQFRTFRIADEFSQLIDQQKVAGIKDVTITKFKIFKVNDSFSGLSLLIDVNSSSMKGLR